MSSVTLSHIEKALAQTPPPKEIKGQLAFQMTHLADALIKEFPSSDVSLWGCVVIGFGVDQLDLTRPSAHPDLINSLQTEDADCSDSSDGIRIDDKILCEFGIVDENSWEQSVKKRLVDTLAKHNLSCQHFRPAQIVDLAVLVVKHSPTQQWVNQVVAVIKSNMASELAPPPFSPHRTARP